MIKILPLLFGLFSITTLAQDNEQFLTEKIRPVTFQMEKSLGSEIKQRLTEEYPKDKINVSVKLTTNTVILAKKLGLNLQKSQFSLPGLDESKEINDSKLLNYNPTTSDVMSAVSDANISVSSSTKFSQTQKNEIQRVVTEEISTLNISNTNISFSTTAAPIVSTTDDEKKSDSQSAPLPQQSSESQQPNSPINSLLIVIVASGTLIAGVIFLSMFFGFRKLERMSKDLSSGLNNMAMSAPATTPQFQAQRSQEQVNLPQAQEFDRYEELAAKVQALLSSKSDKFQVYFEHTVDINDTAKMLILMESISDQSRVQCLEKMPAPFKQRYEEFIAKYSNGSEMEKTMILAAKDIISDFKLIPHDSAYILNKAIKIKVAKLKREHIASVISICNESEFSHIIQLLDPILVASTLASDPKLIDKYKYLAAQKLNSEELKAMSAKLDRYVGPESDAKFTINIASFLSPEVEAEFNRKMGKTNISWEMLNEGQLLELEKFSKTLSISQLSALLAITPENIKGKIQERLPEIKAQQLQRFGIKMTDESFKLKHQFFSQSSTGIVQ